MTIQIKMRKISDREAQFKITCETPEQVEKAVKAIRDAVENVKVSKVE